MTIPKDSLSIGEKVIVEREDLQQLLDLLHGRGYEVIGPMRTGDCIR